MKDPELDHDRYIHLIIQPYVSSVFLYIANITPERIGEVYGISGVSNVGDAWRTISGGYVAEKYRHANKDPVAWFLSLDWGNRSRLIAAAMVEVE